GIRDFHVTGVQTCALPIYNIPSEIELPKWYNERIENLFRIVENILSEFVNKKSEASRHAKVIWAGIHGICVLSLTQKLNFAGSRSEERRVGKECRYMCTTQ